MTHRITQQGNRRPKGHNRRGKSLTADRAFFTTQFEQSIHRLSNFLQSNGSLVSDELKAALKSGSKLEACSLDIDPLDYEDADVFAIDYLARSLLRKSVGFDLGIDRKDAALSAWFKVEEHCAVLNRTGLYNPDIPNWLPEKGTPTCEAVMFTAREKIRKLLGKFSWDDAEVYMSFSGGASTSRTRKEGHPFYKYKVSETKPQVTRSAALLAAVAIWRIPEWRRMCQDSYGFDPCNWVEVVRGSKMTTVPKTSKIDRVIAIEPDMNMFLQKGIGGVIRSRLRTVSIDLRDQTRNQELARIGSRTGSLATIDLSSASDSISLSLVRYLLPPDWYEAIELTRSAETCIDGDWHTLQKVSSMGNGYTFELESLIFWAITSSCVDLLGISDRRIGVYGDDIICHHEATDLLIWSLEYVGFATNTDKSFVKGPFRESCGKHYFYGSDVTPFFVSSQLGEVQDFYWLANSFRTWLSQRVSVNGQHVYNSLVKDCASFGKLCLIDASLSSNQGLIVNLWEAMPFYEHTDPDNYKANRKYNPSFHGWVMHLLRPCRSKTRPDGSSAYLAFLQSVSKNISDSCLMLESGDINYRRRRVITSAWSEVSHPVTLPLRYSYLKN